MTTDIVSKLGSRIRGLRELRRMSQDELASVAGLHRAYVGAVERGEKNVTVRTLQVFAKALDTTIAALFRGIG